MRRVFKLLYPRAVVLNPAEDFEILPKSRLTYANDLLWTYHNADFLRDSKFVESYKWCKKIDNGNLLADYDIQWRIYVLCWAAYQVRNLKGDFVDCGVHTGMCARSVIHFVDFAQLDKKYFLFDTFSGMDERFSSAYEMERSRKLHYADHSDLYERVNETFREFNVEIVKGAIPESLERFSGEKVCFLSIDMNSVVPEIEALEFFWDKMTPGGLVILDDYGYPGCEEQKTAHDNFASSKNTMVLGLPTCQGLIIKT